MSYEIYTPYADGDARILLPMKGKLTLVEK